MPPRSVEVEDAIALVREVGGFLAFNPVSGDEFVKPVAFRFLRSEELPGGLVFHAWGLSEGQQELEVQLVVLESELRQALDQVD